MKNIYQEILRTTISNEYNNKMNTTWMNNNANNICINSNNTIYTRQQKWITTQKIID